jgi:nucleotide-binding universal stress UspA family protein
MGGKLAEAHARSGPPDAEIVRLAEELGSGLVIVGSRGLRSMKRALLGSVSGSVVRHAPASVLVVRDGGHLPGRLLLALDGSEESKAATRAAVEISNSTGSELHLVFALPTVPRPPYAHPRMSESWVDVLQSFKHSPRKFVDGEAKRIEGEGGRVKDAHLRFGGARRGDRAPRRGAGGGPRRGGKPGPRRRGQGAHGQYLGLGGAPRPLPSPCRTR